MCHLSRSYKLLCVNEGYDPADFNPPVYNNALTNCLFYYAKEDSENHARLRELQRLLFKFDDRIIPMTREEEVQFYLNDAKVFKEGKKKKRIDQDFDEFQKDNMYFAEWSSLFSSENPQRIVGSVLPTIKNKILAQKGIFEDKSHYFVIENKINALITQFSHLHGIKSNPSYMNEFNRSDRVKISYSSIFL
jgi:hypothetical protein